jgi:hypothetical protein
MQLGEARVFQVVIPQMDPQGCPAFGGLMAKPMIHARNNVKRWGGVEGDYVAIHDFLDGPKSVHASVKFRAILHHAYGIFLAEKFFGRELINSDGKRVSVRDVAEAHVIEDLGFIPSMDEYLQEMNLKPWMAGVRTVPMKVVD